MSCSKLVPHLVGMRQRPRRCVSDKVGTGRVSPLDARVLEKVQVGSTEEGPDEEKEGIVEENRLDPHDVGNEREPRGACQGHGGLVVETGEGKDED